MRPHEVLAALAQVRLLPAWTGWIWLGLALVAALALVALALVQRRARFGRVDRRGWRPPRRGT